MFDICPSPIIITYDPWQGLAVSIGLSDECLKYSSAWVAQILASVPPPGLTFDTSVKVLLAPSLFTFTFIQFSLVQGTA